MKGLIEGLTVHYVLTQSDAEEINRRRSNAPGKPQRAVDQILDQFPQILKTTRETVEAPDDSIHREVITVEFDGALVTQLLQLARDADDWPAGAQAHVGNPVSAGEHCAMIVAKVWDHAEDGPGTCNGQVILDGNDSLWVTSRYYDESGAPGTWHWIEPA